jgi:hypothetical protein
LAHASNRRPKLGRLAQTPDSFRPLHRDRHIVVGTSRRKQPLYASKEWSRLDRAKGVYGNTQPTPRRPLRFFVNGTRTVSERVKKQLVLSFDNDLLLRDLLARD